MAELLVLKMRVNAMAHIGGLIQTTFHNFTQAVLKDRLFC